LARIFFIIDWSCNLNFRHITSLQGHAAVKLGRARPQQASVGVFARLATVRTDGIESPQILLVNIHAVPVPDRFDELMPNPPPDGRFTAFTSCLRLADAQVTLGLALVKDATVASSFFAHK
jgi:hypothetical protein